MIIQIIYNIFDAISAIHNMCNVCISFKRGMCIKGLKWPPLEQKTEICFSQISLVSFIRRKAEV